MVAVRHPLLHAAKLVGIEVEDIPHRFAAIPTLRYASAVSRRVGAECRSNRVNEIRRFNQIGYTLGGTAVSHLGPEVDEPNDGDALVGGVALGVHLAPAGAPSHLRNLRISSIGAVALTRRYPT